MFQALELAHSVSMQVRPADLPGWMSSVPVFLSRMDAMRPSLELMRTDTWSFSSTKSGKSREVRLKGW